MTTNNLWFWKQNRKQPVRPLVEFVHQTEVSCSNGHDTNYMTIKEVYDILFYYYIQRELWLSLLFHVYACLTGPLVEELILNCRVTAW